MAQKWLRSSPIDFTRNPESFIKEGTAYPDPNGILHRWLDATRIIPLSAKEWKCLDGWRVGPRKLNNSLWFFFPHGSGTVTLEDSGGEFHFGPGDLMLFPKGMSHLVRLKKGVKTTHYSVHFHAYVFGSINLLELLNFPIHLPAPNSSLKERCDRLTKEYTLKPVGWFKIMAAEIFDELLRILRTRGNLFHDRKNSVEELPRLLPAFSLIEERWNDPTLKTADLAESVSMSEVYFRKLFHRIADTSPKLFIQRYKIEQACLLLRSSQMSIKQIAEASGFCDLAFFYRTFRAGTGRTPADFRHAREV